METRDLINFVLVVVALQAGAGIILLSLVRGSPGVSVYSIGVSIVLLVVVSSVIGVVLYWLVNRYMKERAIRTAMMAMSEDEEAVLREIMNEGEIRQDDLRDRFSFSKSKLSALVNNLVEKNAIEKSRYKRTNRLRPTEEFRR